MNLMSATLRRICTPKKGSGKLEVSPEVHKQWLQGGAPRKALLNMLIKHGGDKDSAFQHLISSNFCLFNFSFVLSKIAGRVQEGDRARPDSEAQGQHPGERWLLYKRENEVCAQVERDTRLTLI